MAVIQSKLKALFTPKVPVTARPTKKAEKTIILQATVKAGSAVNTINPLTIIVDPVVGAQASYKIPAGEVWVIDDIWIDKEQPVNGYLKILKNMREEVLPLSPPVNTLLVSNPSRPKISPLTFNQFEDISGYFVQSESGGTSDAVVTVFAHVTIYY